MNKYIFLLVVILVTLLSFHVKTIEGVVDNNADAGSGSGSGSGSVNQPVDGSSGSDVNQQGLENVKAELTRLGTTITGIKTDVCENDGGCGKPAISSMKEVGEAIINQLSSINANIETEKTGYANKIDSLKTELEAVKVSIKDPPGITELNNKLADAETLHSQAAQSYKDMAALYSCNQTEIDGGKCKQDAEDAVTDRLKELLDDRCKLKDAGVDPTDPDVDMGVMTQLLKQFSNLKCKTGADKSLSEYEKLIEQHKEAIKNGGGEDPELNSLLQKLLAQHDSIGSKLSGVTAYSDKIYVADEGKCGTCDRRRRSSYNVMMDPNLQKQCTVKKRKTNTTIYSCPETKPHESKANTFRVCHECQYPVELPNDAKTQAFLFANQQRNRNMSSGVFDQRERGGIPNGIPFNINSMEYKTFTDDYDSGPMGYTQPIDTNNYT